MRVLIPFVLALLLGGCASDLLASQVGQPLSRSVEEFGTPYKAYDTASGQRAFVWLRGDFGMISGYTNTNLYGKAPTNEDYTTAVLGGLEKNRCHYVLFAKPNVARPIAPEHWTVTSAKPILDHLCL